MFQGTAWTAFGKVIAAAVLVGILTATAVRLVGIPEIRAWSQTLRGVVNAGADAGGGTSGANLPTGAR
jgi:hypothetical protein